MATVPVPRSWTTGETVTATIMNATTGVKGAHDFMLSSPRALVYQTATTNMPTSGTSVTMLFDTEQYDTDSIHSTSSNTGRLTCNAAGLYLVVGQVVFASNATGYRQVVIQKNGTTNQTLDRENPVSGVTTPVSVMAWVQLSVSDYVELIGTQTSGGALASTAGFGQTWFGMQWVANS